MRHALALALAVSCSFALAPRASAQGVRPRIEQPPASPPAASPPVATTPHDDAELRRLLGIRRTMSDWMTGLGLGALASMATATVLGAISFHDRYGFRGAHDRTPCARGEALMPDYCEGTVWPQAIASGATTTLYVTAAMLGMFMPDPLGAGEQPGARGGRIRAHRALRIVTSTLVIAQALLGLLVSHADDWLGLDRQRDFDALQALSVVQLGLGVAALGSLSAQGAVMLF